MIVASVNLFCPICMGRLMNILRYHPFSHVIRPSFEIEYDHDAILQTLKKNVEPILYDPASNVYFEGMPNNRILQYVIITELVKIHDKALRDKYGDFILLPQPTITSFNEGWEGLVHSTKVRDIYNEDTIHDMFKLLDNISKILVPWP